MKSKTRHRKSRYRDRSVSIVAVPGSSDRGNTPILWLLPGSAHKLQVIRKGHMDSQTIYRRRWVILSVLIVGLLAIVIPNTSAQRGAEDHRRAAWGPRR